MALVQRAAVVGDAAGRACCSAQWADLAGRLLRPALHGNGARRAGAARAWTSVTYIPGGHTLAPRGALGGGAGDLLRRRICLLFQFFLHGRRRAGVPVADGGFYRAPRLREAGRPLGPRRLPCLVPAVPHG